MLTLVPPRSLPRADSPSVQPPEEAAELFDGDSHQRIIAFLLDGPPQFENQASRGHIEEMVERSGKNIELRCYSGPAIPDELYDQLRVTQLPAIVFEREGREVARIERPKNNATIATVDLCISEFFS